MRYDREIDDYALIQYIIIFALNLVGKSVSYDVLINMLTEELDINYLEFQLALDNLKCTGFVKNFTSEDGRPMYVITEKGKTSAGLFENDIPVYIREPIRESIAPVLKRDHEKRLVRTKVRTLEEDMHYADCSVFDDDDTALLKLSVYAPTREEAVEMTRRFKENPEKIYAGIISLLAD